MLKTLGWSPKVEGAGAGIVVMVSGFFLVDGRVVEVSAFI